MSKPNKKRKEQTFKDQSNSLCQSATDLQLLKLTPSTKKAKRKVEPVEIAASNSGNCLTKNFMKRKLKQLYFLER
jgi:hypothetical protein